MSTDPKSHRSPVRVGDAEFEAASKTAKKFINFHRHPIRALGAMREVPNLKRFMRSLPEVVISRSEINLALEQHFQRSQLCQAVLFVGATHNEYITGQSRHALRTNLNRASESGITCAPVLIEVEKLEIAWALAGALRRFSIKPEDLFARRDDGWIAAHSREGAPIATALTSHSGAWGLLNLLVARSDHRDSSHARWAIHAAAVAQLRSKGVRYMFVEGKSPLVIDPGLQHFQRLNGYQVINVRLVPERRRGKR